MQASNRKSVHAVRIREGACLRRCSCRCPRRTGWVTGTLFTPPWKPCATAHSPSGSCRCIAARCPIPIYRDFRCMQYFKYRCVGVILALLRQFPAFWTTQQQGEWNPATREQINTGMLDEGNHACSCTLAAFSMAAKSLSTSETFLFKTEAGIEGRGRHCSQRSKAQKMLRI